MVIWLMAYDSLRMPTVIQTGFGKSSRAELRAMLGNFGGRDDEDGPRNVINFRKEHEGKSGSFAAGSQLGPVIGVVLCEVPHLAKTTYATSTRGIVGPKARTQPQ